MTVVKIGNLTSESILCMFQLAQKYFVTLLLRTTVFVYNQLLSRRTPVSGGSRGEAPGGPPPLLLDQTEARRSKKTFC